MDSSAHSITLTLYSIIAEVYRDDDHDRWLIRWKFNDMDFWTPDGIHSRPTLSEAIDAALKMAEAISMTGAGNRVTETLWNAGEGVLTWQEYLDFTSHAWKFYFAATRRPS